MTDLINARQAAPFAKRSYQTTISHIRKDYARLKAGKPTRIFHTIVYVEGGRPKWWVSKADAIAFASMTLTDKGGRPRKETKRRGGAK